MRDFCASGRSDSLPVGSYSLQAQASPLSPSSLCEDTAADVSSVFLVVKPSKIIFLIQNTIP